MSEPNVSTLILPTTGEDIVDLAYDLLRTSLSVAQQWCMFNKFNIRMVFMYFSRKTIPLARASHAHYLNALCLCLLARYFLVYEITRIDRRMCLVVKNLTR